jgi:hypothetical protein
LIQKGRDMQSVVDVFVGQITRGLDGDHATI